ncbi:UNVERIFIED_ORG: hypothetical protein HNP28_000319 [Comamonas terrigena]
MLYYQISEVEYNRLEAVCNQIGLLAGLLEIVPPGKNLPSITAGQMGSFMSEQFDALQHLMQAVDDRGVGRVETEKPKPALPAQPRRRSREHLARGAAA